MGRMLEHANLVVTAWDGVRLVGMARCLTDFSYAAYLSDLAVDRAYQRRGIGRELIHRVQQAIDPAATIVLLAAPAAVEYYPRIGMRKHPSAWTIPAGADLR
jgi:ribosomal protein S18 acetylase RimI-like enzyme